MDTKELQKRCNINSTRDTDVSYINHGQSDKQMLKLLCSPENERTIDNKGIVYLEGDLGCECYILLDGELEVRKNVNGASKAVASITPGSLFGELALFRDVRRNATIRAKNKAKVAKIDRETFNKAIQKNPKLAIYLLKSFAEKHTNMDTITSY